jgi:hypothetical protein
VIEAGAELAGLHLLDRFTGTLCADFPLSRLDIPICTIILQGKERIPRNLKVLPDSQNYMVQLTGYIQVKISKNWAAIWIRRQRSFLNAPGLNDIDSRKVMIYPNSAKIVNCGISIM